MNVCMYVYMYMYPAHKEIGRIYACECSVAAAAAAAAAAAVRKLFPDAYELQRTLDCNSSVATLTS